MEVWAATDKGRIRARNEDAVRVTHAGPASDVLIMAIADGMGGHRGGEIASRIAVEEVSVYLERSLRNLKTGDNSIVVMESLGKAIQAANSGIVSFSSRFQTYRGMGTTLTVIVMTGGKAYLGHVGDSRAYLIRDGEIVQLTEDHSVVGELLREGRISQIEAMFHPHRHLLTRALGVTEPTDPDVRQVELAPDDILLMCTDGLTGAIEPNEILHYTTLHRDELERLPDKLIELANQRGGFDNVTVVLCRYRPQGVFA